MAKIALIIDVLDYSSSNGIIAYADNADKSTYPLLKIA